MLKNVTHAVAHPRFGFRDGWLYYSDDEELFRFRVWPEVIAERRQAKNDWQSIRCAFRDLLVAGFWGDSYVFRNGIIFIPHGNAFYERSTGQVCMAWVMENPERRFAYGCHHWRQLLAMLPVSLLRCAGRLECDFFSAVELFVQAPAAMDLVEHNPLLATALARHWEFPGVRCKNWPEVRQQIGRRRRDILGWLGFSPEQSTLNALERLLKPARTSCAGMAIKRILTFLSDPVLGPILKRAGGELATLIIFLTHPMTAQWFDPRCLKQSKRVMNRMLHGHLWKINEFLDAKFIDIETAKTLQWCKPSRAPMEWLRPYLKELVFPPAPVPGTDKIEYIATPEKLMMEGDEMLNCLGAIKCVRAAMGGRIAFYRVMAPVRATLAIFNGPMGDEEKQILDIKGPRNVEIPLEHIKQIAKIFPPGINFEKWINACLGERMLWWRFVG